MRHEDEEDPKKPQPVAVPKKKEANALEAAEGSPWLIRKDNDRDRHRHVV